MILKVIKKYWILILILIISILISPIFGIISPIIGLIMNMIIVIYNKYEEEKQKIEDEKRHNLIVTKLDKIKQENKSQKILEQVKEAIRIKKIDLESLFQKLRTPLYAIMIQKYFEPPKLIQRKLEEKGFKIIGTGVYILPPSKCPEIKSGFNLGSWIESNILKDLQSDYKYLINFACVVDLRYLFSKRVHSKKGRTVFEVLQNDPSFLSEIIFTLENTNLTISEIINKATLDFLIEDGCTPNELIKLKNASEEILNKFNCKQLTDLRLISKESLSESIQKYCQNNLNLSEQIINNAKFWYGFLSK